MSPSADQNAALLGAEQLLALARQKSADSRAELAEAMTALFGEQRGTLTEREVDLLGDILHQVLSEVELSVRSRLGSVLADYDDTPRDLVRFLANDHIEIAYPILLHSRVLMDNDLIEVVRQRGREHQLAIAMREGIGETVSEAIVEQGHTNVIVELLNNTSAKISEDTMTYLVERSREVNEFQRPLLRRDDLDEPLVRRMFTWVSAALRKYIITNWEVDPSTVDEGLETALNQGIRAFESDAAQSGADDLATRIMNEKKDLPQTLLSALQAGEIDLFVALFHLGTGLRKILIRRLLFEPGGEGLAIACKALGMSLDQFIGVFRLSRHARGENPDPGGDLIPDLSTLYDHITDVTARQVVQRWTRETDYQVAIRDLELAFDA
ncbi:MAG: DUF2336 domain-containing protein [Rhodospirillaceae bacterium]